MLKKKYELNLCKGRGEIGGGSSGERGLEFWRGQGAIGILRELNSSFCGDL